ncbi:hypothetical protein MC885_021898 [Smutsia gigantea]|nr:hypothetical protein MC885_021898 [Smutsia gigantea]
MIPEVNTATAESSRCRVRLSFHGQPSDSRHRVHFARCQVSCTSLLVGPTLWCCQDDLELKKKKSKNLSLNPTYIPLAAPPKEWYSLFLSLSLLFYSSTPLNCPHSPLYLKRQAFICMKSEYMDFFPFGKSELEKKKKRDKAKDQHFLSSEKKHLQLLELSFIQAASLHLPRWERIGGCLSQWEVLSMATLPQSPAKASETPQDSQPAGLSVLGRSGSSTGLLSL